MPLSGNKVPSSKQYHQRGSEMQQAMQCLIHTFEPSGTPCFDEDGEQLIGSYYQFVDETDKPIGALHGPYRDNEAAESAATQAYHRRDF